jgi:type II secretory pathway pseudopilin PulG
MKQNGFTYVELLISLLLLLTALLFLGRANMTSLHLIGKGKLNQRATLLLLDKIEQLRNAGILELIEGEFEEEAGLFRIDWKIRDNTPYFGTKQVQCRVSYIPAASVIAESIFYRSE